MFSVLLQWFKFFGVIDFDMVMGRREFLRNGAAALGVLGILHEAGYGKGSAIAKLRKYASDNNKAVIYFGGQEEGKTFIGEALVKSSYVRISLKPVNSAEEVYEFLKNSGGKLEIFNNIRSDLEKYIKWGDGDFGSHENDNLWVHVLHETVDSDGRKVIIDSFRLHEKPIPEGTKKKTDERLDEIVTKYILGLKE